jgi:large conductance mechanosensitive channel
MGMLKEFKSFAMKGNLVDIAVGFVMGSAFVKVVSAFTGGIVSPLIALVAETDMKAFKWVVSVGSPEVKNEAGEVVTKAVAEVAILWGEFLTYTLDFIIVAFVMFMVIKGVNRMKKKEEPAPAVDPGPSEKDLLSEIRDLLKK